MKPASCGLDLLPAGRVQGDVATRPALVEQAGADVFQALLDGGPILVDLVEQVAQEEQVADPADLLVGPAGLAKVGAQAGVDHAVPGAHQPAFERGFFFERHLAEALAVVQARAGEHIAQDGEQFAGLGQHGFAAQEQPGLGLGAARRGGDEAWRRGCRRW